MLDGDSTVSFYFPHRRGAGNCMRCSASGVHIRRAGAVALGLVVNDGYQNVQPLKSARADAKAIASNRPISNECRQLTGLRIPSAKRDGGRPDDGRLSRALHEDRHVGGIGR